MLCLSSIHERARRTSLGTKPFDRLRSSWLNPSEWTHEEILTFPGSVDGPWSRYVENANGRSIGTVRYPRLAANDEECAKQLAKRTLTNLYNQRPAWLDHAQSPARRSRLRRLRLAPRSHRR